MPGTLNTSPLTRRRFLQSSLAVGTALGAGSLLESCNTSSSGGSTGGTTTITIMGNSGEITKQYLDDFQKLHTDIKVHYLEYNGVGLSSMLAAGNPPEIVRAEGASVMPNIIARGLATNLDPYFAKSSVLSVSNLEPVNNVYRWNGKEQGVGPLYGMAKDWSPDVMMWYNKKLFDQAGVPYPDETNPMTYDDLLALGKKLTVRENGKIKVYGLSAEWGFVNQGHLVQMVAQQGGSLYNSDLTAVDFTTPQARKAVKWYVDWAQAHIGPSPLDPDPAGWDGPTFLADRIAISMYGYWFGGQIASGSSNLQAGVGFLPAPLMGENRISACLTGTGLWIPAASKHKDAAWTFMEYFMGQKPATDRASSGWGVPSLKSLQGKMPQEKPYQKQAYDALQRELPYLKVLTFSPYISNDAFTTALSKAIEPVMHGTISFDQGIQQLNDSVNLLLQQGKEQIG